jgi:hypothetical protein
MRFRALAMLLNRTPCPEIIGNDLTTTFIQINHEKMENAQEIIF